MQEQHVLRRLFLIFQKQNIFRTMPSLSRLQLAVATAAATQFWLMPIAGRGPADNKMEYYIQLANILQAALYETTGKHKKNICLYLLNSAYCLPTFSLFFLFLCSTRSNENFAKFAISL